MTIYSVRYGASAEDGESPTQGQFVVIDGGLTTTSGTWDFCPVCKFKLVDAASRQYDAYDITPPVFTPALESRTLRPGVKARGLVGFDVPRGRYEVQLTDDSGTVIATWHR